MTCTKCKKGSFKEVAREANWQGRTYVLLECDRCSFTVIRPEGAENAVVAKGKSQ